MNSTRSSRRNSWFQSESGSDVKLSSLNARSAGSGGGAQPLHADMAALADERGYWACNALWLLDDYTAQNGALRVVPGSHRRGGCRGRRWSTLWRTTPVRRW